MIEINDTDKLNPLWGKLMDMWEERLAVLRRKNDGDLTEFQTAKVRGQIAELRSWMGKDKDKPVIE